MSGTQRRRMPDQLPQRPSRTEVLRRQPVRRSLMVILAAAAGAGLVAASSAGQEGPPRPTPDPAKARAPRWDERNREAEARRRREHNSAAARQRRQASRTRHRGLGRDDALALARKRFGAQITRPPWQPLRLGDGETVERYRTRHVALVDTPDDGTVLVESSLPLRSKQQTGELRPVNLELDEQAQHFAARNPLVPVRIHRQPDKGVSFDAAGFAIGLQGAERADAALLANNSVFFANAATDTDLLVTPAPTGAELAWQIRAASAPEQFELTLELEDGMRLHKPSDGPDRVQILRGDEPVALIQSPLAWDSDRTPVEVTYSLDGNSVLVAVAHRDRDLHYPLYVDPLVDNYRLGTTTDPNQASPKTGGSADELAFKGWDFLTSASRPFLHSRNGTTYGNGLYAYTKDGQDYAANDYGEWVWRVPRATAYIHRADFGYVNHDVGSPLTCLIEGIYRSDILDWDYGRWQQPTGQLQPLAEPSSPWTGGTAYWYPKDNRYPCGPQSGNYKAHYPSTPANANVMVFGLEAAGAGIRNPRGLAYMYGASIFLDDRQPPTATATVDRSGWLHSGPAKVTVNASDATGLGARAVNFFPGGQASQAMYMHASASSPGPWSADSTQACAGTGYISPCPQTSNPEFTVSLDAMPEGSHTYGGNVYDPLGKTGSYSVPFKIDHSKPSAATLSGSLLAAGGVQKGDTHELTLAGDDAYSGVRVVAVTIDGQTIPEPPDPNNPNRADGYYDRGCGPASGCTPTAATHTWKVDTSSLTLGDHSVQGTVRDAVGHETAVTGTLKVIDTRAPTLQISGGLRNWPIETGRDLTVTAKDGGVGVDDIKVYIKTVPDGTVTPDTTGPPGELIDDDTCTAADCSSFTPPTYELPDKPTGTYQITVQAHDKSRNPATERWILRVVQTRDNRRAKLGLEQWFDMDDTDSGGQSRMFTNGETGNLVWHHVPIVNQGRGLSAAVSLTYNSGERGGILGLNLGKIPLIGAEPADTEVLGNDLAGLAYQEAGVGFSLAISGPTRVNDTLGGVLAARAHEVLLAAHDSAWTAPGTTEISLTDADGTRHIFRRSGPDPTVANSTGDTAWRAPAGFNMRLRYTGPRGGAALGTLDQDGLQSDKSWELLRPDGVRFYFDRFGYLQQTTDRDGNTLDYVYTGVDAATGQTCDNAAIHIVRDLQNGLGLCVQQLTEVRLPGWETSSRELTLTYTEPQGPLSALLPSTLPAGTVLAAPIDAPQVKTITDTSGRSYRFDYDSDGYLTELHENAAAQDASAPRVTRFAYEDKTLVGEVTKVIGNLRQLEKVTPVEGTTEKPGTAVDYTGNAATAPTALRPVNEITKRDGSPKLLAYTQTDGRPGGFRVFERTSGNRWLDRQSSLDDGGRPVQVTERTSTLTDQDTTSATAVAAQGSTTTALAWNTAENKPATLTEAAGTAKERTTTYGYRTGGSGALTSRTVTGQGETKQWTFEYAPDREAGFISDLTKIVAPGPRAWTYTVDANGHPTTTTTPAGVAMTSTYGPNGVLLSQEDEMGRVTTFSDHDPSGQPQTGTLPADPDVTRVWRYDYDARGDLTTVVDPRSPTGATGESDPFVTTLTYDAFGRLTHERIPRNSAPNAPAQDGPAFITRKRGFDRDGNATTITDPRGKISRVQYDAMGQPAAVIRQGGSTANAREEITRYVYDDAQRRIAITAPRGQSTSGATGFAETVRSEHIAACGQDTAAGAHPFTTRLCLDHRGRPLAQAEYSTQAEDLPWRVTAFAYDERGNTVGVSDPNRNTTTATDGAQQPSPVAAAIANAGDPQVRRLSAEYDVLDRLTRQIEHPAVDTAPDRPRRFSYDEAGDLREIAEEDPNEPDRITRMDYDKMGWLLAHTDPLGRLTCTKRQADGLVVALTTPRGTAGAQADCLDPAQQYTHSTTRFTYDAIGGVSSRSIPYTPDQYGPGRSDVPTWKVTYGRDAVGNPKTITDARGHRFTNEFYDTGELRETGRPSWWQLDWGAAQSNPDPGMAFTQDRAPQPGTGRAADASAGDSQATADQADVQVAVGGPSVVERDPLEPSAAGAEVSDSAPDLTAPGQTDFGWPGQETPSQAMPLAGTAHLRYDEEMRLTELLDQVGLDAEAAGVDRHVRRIAYDDAGRIARKSWPLDERGIAHDFAYDPNGNLTGVVEDFSSDIGRVTTTFGYDGYDRRISETTPGAHSTESATGDPETEVTRFAYDANDNLLSRETPRGQRSTATGDFTFGYGYDSLDELTWEKNPAGETWHYRYDRFGDLREQEAPHAPTAPRSLYTTYLTYDLAGQLTGQTRQVDQPGQTPQTLAWELGYDADGNRNSVVAPGAPDPISTRVDHDGRGLPWRTTVSGGTGDQALSRTSITEYDANANPRRDVRPAGVDPATRLPRSTDDGSNDAANLEAASQDAVVRVFDTDDLQVSERFPWHGADDTRYVREWDRESVLGWITGMKSPRPVGASTGYRRTYRHNQAGWITAVSDEQRAPVDATGALPAQISYAYDQQGHQVKWRSVNAATDDTGRDIRWTYWPNGQVRQRSAVKTLTATEETQRTYRYLYNANRSLVRVIDTDALRNVANNQARTTVFARDAAERQTRIDETWRAGTDAQLIYDTGNTGWLTTRRTDGDFIDGDVYAGAHAKTTTFTYDSLGRELSMTVDPPDAAAPDRPTQTRWYGGGMMRHRVKPNGTKDQWTWNGLGEKVRHERIPSGQASDPHPQGYAYDTNGNRTWDERGTHDFNARDQLVFWKRPSEHCTGGRLGNCTTREDRLGWTTSYTLDGTGAQTNRIERDPAGTVQVQTDFTYAGEELQKSVTTDSSSGTAATVTFTYAYDDAGNVQRIHRQGDGATTAPDETALSLEECKASDTQSSSEVTRYCYDEFNRQVFASGSAIEPFHVSYDGLDRRDRKVRKDALAGAETEGHDYSYVGTSELLATEVLSTAGVATKRHSFDYDSAGDRQGLQVTETGETPRYRPYAKDANGSVLALEHETTGAIEPNDRYAYDPYGELDRKPSPGTEVEDPDAGLSPDAAANPFRFEGFYYDSGVKTYDMHARAYRPEIGRFLQRDQYASAAGDQALEADPLTQNRYAFAGANPITNIEFDGHDPHAAETQARGCFSTCPGARNKRAAKVVARVMSDQSNAVRSTRPPGGFFPTSPAVLGVQALRAPNKPTKPSRLTRLMRGASDAAGAAWETARWVERSANIFEFNDYRDQARQNWAGLKNAFSSPGDTIRGIATPVTDAYREGGLWQAGPVFLGAVAAAATSRGAGGAKEPTMRHYTTRRAAEAIEGDGTIMPGRSGKIWVTPDHYASGSEAMKRLALGTQPEGFFEIPLSRLPGITSPTRVRRANGQFGGGLECTVTCPVDVHGLSFRRIP